MSDISTSSNILRVNAAHQRIGWNTPKEAFTALMGGFEGSPPYMAIDIQYAMDSDGNPITNEIISMQRVPWDEWKNLRIRHPSLDTVVQTIRGPIRVPTVVVCPNFHTMPKKSQKPTPTAIRRRDGNICQYTGQVLTNKTFSLDHIVPRSKGGKNSWQNLVSAHKDINSRKGNKFNHEMKLKLLKQPLAPKEIPLCAYYTEVKHPDHQWF